MTAQVERELLCICARPGRPAPRGRSAGETTSLRSYQTRYPPEHQVPIKAGSWEEDPGLAEIDLVSHSGPSARGVLAHTLNVTDIATGWTENPRRARQGPECVVDALEHQPRR